MAKRQATKDLNHENWDVEEEEEEPGNFVPINQAELKNRVIKKAKRSVGSKDADSSSPFAAFSGFTSSKPKTPTVSCFTKINVSSPASSPFVIKPEKVAEKQNGNSESNKGQDNIEDAAVKTPFKSTIVSKDIVKTRSIEYYRQLQSLNESVFKWMKLHLSKNSCCDFTPVFNDYKKHLDTLNVTYPIKRKLLSPSPTSSITKDNTDNFSFKKPATTITGSSSPKPSNNFFSTSSGFFKFGNSSSSASTSNEKDETDYGAHFASNTTNTSTVSYGKKMALTETSSITPKGPTTACSEEEESKNDKKSPTFSFGLQNKTVVQGNSEASSENVPFSFSFAPVVKSTENETSEDVEYVPPKNDFTAVSEVDAFYSKKCKLFFQKDGSFVEKGVGMLYLKPIDDKTQLLIRADTNLGNILLNIMLSASLPTSRTGKNNVLIVCVPNPPLDIKNPESIDAIPILIRVKTREDADDLMELLKKHAS